VASSFGKLLDVDWSSLFKSVYEKVRVRVACRNLGKIPMERLFEMDNKLYMLSIPVEGLEHREEGRSDKDDGDHGDDEDGTDDEGFDDLHDLQRLHEY
jgi:hypothetical protein